MLAAGFFDPVSLGVASTVAGPALGAIGGIGGSILSGIAKPVIGGLMGALGSALGGNDAGKGFAKGWQGGYTDQQQAAIDEKLKRKDESAEAMIPPTPDFTPNLQWGAPQNAQKQPFQAQFQMPQMNINGFYR